MTAYKSMGIKPVKNVYESRIYNAIYFFPMEAVARVFSDIIYFTAGIVFVLFLIQTKHLGKIYAPYLLFLLLRVIEILFRCPESSFTHDMSSFLIELYQLRRDETFR